jgi:CheY-like chemotaxis protein
MVVEDNADTANALRDLLEMWGHRVCVASTGDEALRFMPAFQPEVMLVDIGLPGIDGYEVARRVRRSALFPPRSGAGEAQLGVGEDEQTARGKETQPLLVVVTGYGQEEDHRRAREAGFDCYLVKPPSPEVLQEILLLGRDAPYRC